VIPSPGVLLGLGLAAGGGLLVWSHWIEPFRIRRVERRIGLPGLETPLRVLHLSDLHLRPGMERRVACLLAALRGHGADLVLLGGDYVDEEAALPLFARVLDALDAPLGIYAVKGNHEIYHYGFYHLFNGKETRGTPKDSSRLYGLLAERGVRLLVNDHCRLEVPGAVHLIGVDDYFTGRGGLAAAMEGLPEEGVRILLSHSPAVQLEFSGRRVDVAFCGHTHGGQLRLPLVGVIASRSPLPADKVSGCYRSGGAFVCVGNGIAEGKHFPFRFRSPPEIILTTLEPARSAQLLEERVTWSPGGPRGSRCDEL
jgi:hypothetical protein